LYLKSLELLEDLLKAYPHKGYQGEQQNNYHPVHEWSPLLSGMTISRSEIICKEAEDPDNLLDRFERLNRLIESLPIDCEAAIS